MVCLMSSNLTLKYPCFAFLLNFKWMQLNASCLRLCGAELICRDQSVWWINNIDPQLILRPASQSWGSRQSCCWMTCLHSLSRHDDDVLCLSHSTAPNHLCHIPCSKSFACCPIPFALICFVSGCRIADFGSVRGGVGLLF